MSDWKIKSVIMAYDSNCGRIALFTYGNEQGDEKRDWEFGYGNVPEEYWNEEWDCEEWE